MQAQPPLTSTSCEKMAKRRATVVGNPRSKTRRTGLDPAWNNYFPWMLPTEDGTGMVCSLCRKRSRHPKKSVVGRAVWTDIPCQLITRHALVKHSRSESHIEAVKMEATLSSSRADGRIRIHSRVLSQLKERQW